MDMQLRAFWRMFSIYNERRFEKGRVLLTGATGFLGAFLLRELLTQTKVCLMVLPSERQINHDVLCRMPFPC